MATWDDVRRIALALPDTSEGESWGNHTFLVHGKQFAWARPLNKADLGRLVGDPPEGQIIAAYVDDLDTKDALITEEPDTFFTIEHFDGFRAVLIPLARIEVTRLEDILTDAWLARAPKKAAAAFLADSSG